jgi:hypothetical protein
MGSLVSDIPARDGKLVNLFFTVCALENKPFQPSLQCKKGKTDIVGFAMPLSVVDKHMYFTGLP